MTFRHQTRPSYRSTTIMRGLNGWYSNPLVRLLTALVVIGLLTYLMSASRAEARGGSRSVSCLRSPQLIAKVREIQRVCGSRVVSTCSSRPNRSNHPRGLAADMQGNPRCIYRLLRGFPGGYSTDYGRVNHVHISYNRGGQEWGARFAHHRGPRVTRTLHARTRYRSKTFRATPRSAADIAPYPYGAR